MPDRKMYDKVMTCAHGERLDYDASLTWVDLFRGQIQSHEEKTAVVAENGSLTYAQLERMLELFRDYVGWMMESPDKPLSLLEQTEQSDGMAGPYML